MKNVKFSQSGLSHGRRTYLVELIEHRRVYHLTENLFSRNEQALSRWILSNGSCCCRIYDCSILLQILGRSGSCRPLNIFRGIIQPGRLCLRCQHDSFLLKLLFGSFILEEVMSVGLAILRVTACHI